MSVNNNSGLSDAYSRMRYSTAFDQEAVYRRHRKVIAKLGCAQNVLLEDLSRSASDSPVGEKELAQYETACLQPLNRARFVALAEPGLFATAEIGLMVTGALTTRQFVGSESLGGSFSIFAAVSDCLRVLPTALRSGRDLISPPDNSLASLETCFAKNKCYIPRVLWPKIMNAFMSARQDPFTKEKHTNFLTFALSFTTYKHKPALVFQNNMGAEGVKLELNRRIDQFFTDYDRLDAVEYIKINVSKFIDSLMNHGGVPRYLYLHGVGGVGKTYFVQTLAHWIDELVPNSIRFENLIINASDELEGTADRPGAILKVLRNQLMQNRNGSIIIIDEATWVNDASMISAAKRVFNGDRSKLSASYFGTDIGGDSISLEIPPMLIFIASNESIHDAALESRFDVVNYPIPTQQALIAHAGIQASRSEVLKQAQCKVNETRIATWIQGLEAKNRNFRYVAGNVEALLLRQQKTRKALL